MPPGPTDGPSNSQRPPVLSDAPEKCRSGAHGCLQDPQMPPRNQMDPLGPMGVLQDPWMSPDPYYISLGPTEVLWFHRCPLDPWVPTRTHRRPYQTQMPPRTHRCHQNLQMPPAHPEAPGTHRCPQNPHGYTPGTHGCHQKTQMCLGPMDVSRTWGCSRDPQMPPGPTEAHQDLCAYPKEASRTHRCHQATQMPLDPWMPPKAPGTLGELRVPQLSMGPPPTPPPLCPLVSPGVRQDVGLGEAASPSTPRAVAGSCTGAGGGRGGHGRGGSAMNQPQGMRPASCPTRPWGRRGALGMRPPVPPPTPHPSFMGQVLRMGNS